MKLFKKIIKAVDEKITEAAILTTAVYAGIAAVKAGASATVIVAGTTAAQGAMATASVQTTAGTMILSKVSAPILTKVMVGTLWGIVVGMATFYITATLLKQYNDSSVQKSIQNYYNN